MVVIYDGIAVDNICGFLYIAKFCDLCISRVCVRAILKIKETQIRNHPVKALQQSGLVLHVLTVKEKREHRKSLLSSL